MMWFLLPLLLQFHLGSKLLDTRCLIITVGEHLCKSSILQWMIITLAFHLVEISFSFHLELFLDSSCSKKRREQPLWYTLVADTLNLNQFLPTISFLCLTFPFLFFTASLLVFRNLRALVPFTFFRTLH